MKAFKKFLRNFYLIFGPSIVGLSFGWFLLKSGISSNTFLFVILVVLFAIGNGILMGRLHKYWQLKNLI